MAFSPDGRTLVSTSGDGEVRIWDVSTQRHLHTINVHGIVALVFHPSKQMFALGHASNSRLDFYNPATGQLLQRSTYSGYPVAFHPNGQFMVLGHAKEFRIYKLVTANRLDANKDGQVNIKDLIAVATDYGRTGDRSTDVNNDNRVDIKDLTAVAKAVNPNFAAPTLAQEATTLPFTAEQSNNGFKTRKSKVLMPRGLLPWNNSYKAVLHKQPHRRKPSSWQTIQTRSTQKRGYLTS